ncbi:hypothetical protein [Nonomuraea sp. NPDC049158]|uniref:hypothetical protein n=1 Tax=Nonomuraea sp. NPDC049158 TaxID=3155649 RepID=UPI0033EA7CA0
MRKDEEGRLGYEVGHAQRIERPDKEFEETGAWLLSELVERAAPMMDELPSLLTSPIRNVRY